MRYAIISKNYNPLELKLKKLIIHCVKQKENHYNLKKFYFKNFSNLILMCTYVFQKLHERPKWGKD